MITDYERTQQDKPIVAQITASDKRPISSAKIRGQSQTVDGYQLFDAVDGKRYALDVELNLAICILETNDYVWYADDDNERAVMFAKDASGTVTHLASDNFFAQDAIDEACEQIWKGVITPVYADEARLSLEEQAQFQGWSKSDRAKPSCGEIDTGVFLKAEASAMQQAAEHLDTVTGLSKAEPAR